MTKHLILIIISIFTCIAGHAQTQRAQEMFSKATATGADIDKIIAKECADADSTSCNDLAVMFFRADDLNHAAQSWEFALKKVKKFGKAYEQILSFLTAIYNETGDSEGIARTMALCEEHNRHELTLPCSEPGCMIDRAEYYMSTGNNAKAKECYLKAFDMDMTETQKIRAYRSYSIFLFNTREFVSAADYAMMAAKMELKENGESEDYIQWIYKAAVYDFLGKKYEAAIETYRKAIDYYGSHPSEKSDPAVAECRNGIGNALSAMKRHAEAKHEYRLSLDYYEQKAPDSKEHAAALSRLATAEKFNGNYDESIEHYRKSIDMYRALGMYQEANDTQNSLSFCYTYAGRKQDNDEEIEKAAKKQQDAKLDGIIKDELETLELTKTYLGQLQYAQSLGLIAGCHMMKGEYDRSIECYQRFMTEVRQALRDEFRMLNEQERMTLWDKLKINIDDILDMVAAVPLENESLMPGLAAVAYDAMLLSKGILLNSSIAFEKVIADSDDENLKKLYAETKNNTEEINRLRASASTDADLEKILALQQQNRQLQLALYSDCAEISDFTDYMGYDWKDVRKRLSKNDLAIEFTAVNSGFPGDSHSMAAIVLGRDMKTPAIVPICDNNTIDAISKNRDKYVDSSVGEQVWGPLADYIKDKKRVYFSADGKFNTIGIEYMLYDGKPLCDQKEVYRLSTTKELCYSRRRPETKSAVLFGDINYNEPGAALSQDTQMATDAMRGSAGNAPGEFHFSNLDNTKREITEISDILSAGKVGNILTLKDSEATDSAFMALNDTKVNIMHIATHGDYRSTTSKDTDDAMKNSILAFAGANLNDGTGIITASDIAGMNLRQCGLAVLSACETGLGKISSDGVFGLQRGFKNAGVRTLLMSLKEVSDDATAEMMVQFYKALMCGDAPAMALNKAQRYLRTHGFDDPKYWATFIILDGQQ